MANPPPTVHWVALLVLSGVEAVVAVWLASTVALLIQPDLGNHEVGMALAVSRFVFPPFVMLVMLPANAVSVRRRGRRAGQLLAGTFAAAFALLWVLYATQAFLPLIGPAWTVLAPLWQVGS